MSLIQEFERSGNTLFRYRGQIPVLFFILATPVVIFTDYAWLSPIYGLVITCVAIVFSVAGACVRAYTIGTTPAGTSGRNTDKQVAEQLNTTGIYSSVRHPLYLGNYLMWAGLLIFTANPWFFILVSLIYWIYYERIMFAEEGFLRSKFGEDYTVWSVQTPAFLPRLKTFKKPSVPYSQTSVLRREYSGWLALSTGFVYVDLLRHWDRLEASILTRPSVLVFCFFLLLTIILRSLKHHTNLLTESGRS